VASEPLVRSIATVVGFGLVKPIGKQVVEEQRNLLSSPFVWLELDNSGLCPVSKD
jgi:hypothetical protein